MNDTFTGARRSQIAFAVLLAVCAAQVGWWMLDQWVYTAEVQRRIEREWQQSLSAARAMRDRGIEASTVDAMFPDLVIDGAGDFEVAPTARDAAEAERSSRLNRYAWEGGFFLVVLSAAITVLWRAVGVEMRLRRRQRNFVTAVTHELKSPLASVRLSAETLLRRDADAPTRSRLLGRLLNSLDRMEATVSNVLETARIDEHKLSLQPDIFPPAQSIAGIIDAMEPSAHSAGVTLRSSCSDGLVVRVDRRAFETVIRNLVANAIAATDGMPDGRVTVSAVGGETLASVEVADNGCGFPPEDAEKLFEKFYRPGDELRREGRGTGLGLYIARAMVSASGGRLSAHSEGPGHGARFRSTWPQPDTGIEPETDAQPSGVVR